MAGRYLRVNGAWVQLGQGEITPPTQDTTPPSTPTNLRTTSVGITQASLAWNAATDNIAVTGYHVQRGSGTPVTVTGTSYTDASLAGGTTYQWRVRAFDAAGNTSAWSSYVTATTQPAVGGNTRALLGMSAPSGDWSARRSEVEATGGRLEARRIFFSPLTDTGPRSLVTQAVNAGMYPVMSFKPSPYSWKEVAAGQADAALRSIRDWLATIPYGFVCLNHEPGKTGHNPLQTDDAQDPTATPGDFAAMNLHALPILKQAGPHIQVGVIMNGWMSIGNTVDGPPSGNGYSDAEFAQWLPPELRQICDVIAGDDYQVQASTADPSLKTLRRIAWAKRMGDVNGVGVGEFNAFDNTYLQALIDAVGSDPLVKWGLVWNNTLGTSSVVLSGTRLATFQNELLHWRDDGAAKPYGLV